MRAGRFRRSREVKQNISVKHEVSVWGAVLRRPNMGVEKTRGCSIRSGNSKPSGTSPVVG